MDEGAPSLVEGKRLLSPVQGFGKTMGGHRMENRFWAQTLQSLAAHLGVDDADVTTTVVCIDKKRR